MCGQIWTTWRAPSGEATAAGRRPSARPSATLRQPTAPWLSFPRAPRLRKQRCRRAPLFAACKREVARACRKMSLYQCLVVQEDAPELFALLRGTGLLPHVGLLEVAQVAPPPQVPRLLTLHTLQLLPVRQGVGLTHD